MRYIDYYIPNLLANSNQRSSISSSRSIKLVISFFSLGKYEPPVLLHSSSISPCILCSVLCFWVPPTSLGCLFIRPTNDQHPHDGEVALPKFNFNWVSQPLKPLIYRISEFLNDLTRSRGSISTDVSLSTVDLLLSFCFFGKFSRQINVATSHQSDGSRSPKNPGAVYIYSRKFSLAYLISNWFEFFVTGLTSYLGIRIRTFAILLLPHRTLHDVRYLVYTAYLSIHDYFGDKVVMGSIGANADLCALRPCLVTPWVALMAILSSRISLC